MYSETLINRHSFNHQFLLTVSPYSMYSNQIAAKNHPRFIAEWRTIVLLMSHVLGPPSYRTRGQFQLYVCTYVVLHILYLM
jgi:hypothetical protein